MLEVKFTAITQTELVNQVRQWLLDEAGSGVPLGAGFAAGPGQPGPGLGIEGGGSVPKPESHGSIAGETPEQAAGMKSPIGGAA